jgi:multicomponent Na+:H+ antiporter subunit B
MITTKSTTICVVISNLISAIMVFLYCILQAPDIAITEAVIGTATGTILYALSLLYIKKLPTSKLQNQGYSIDVRQRIFVFVLCIVFFALILHVIQNLTLSTKAGTVTNVGISRLYILNAFKDFHFDSIVTAVVAGYRAFDTMFENVVIFTACYGFYTLLTMDVKKDYFEENNNNNTKSESANKTASAV